MNDGADRDLPRAKTGEVDAHGRPVIASPFDLGQPVGARRVTNRWVNGS